MNYFKNYFLYNSTLRSLSIAAICDFYRWLINQYPEFNLFNNSFTITRQLLFNRHCVIFINEDYYFTTFSPQNHPGNREKIVFILRGFENQSTRLMKEDFFSVNLSKVKNSVYRKSIISYIISSKSITIAISNCHTGYMLEAMNFITNIKAQPNYPNPSLMYMTNQEAVLIRNFFNDESLQSSTLNNKIGSIRRFLMWNKDAKLIEFDDMFFNYLIQYEEPSYTSGNSIPDDKLEALNKYIIADSKENFKARLMYVIFHIAIQTEFRISQICHLLTNSIKPSVKPNEYIIHSNSKTSHGKKKKEIITNLTYHLLMSAIVMVVYNYGH